MTTIAELVVEDPATTDGVPIQVNYGSGQWRLVVQLADPAAGASVVWYDVTTYVWEMRWKRGGDQAFGRYRACQPSLLIRGTGDQFATWNEDTSSTFGTHVRVRGGLLMRAVVFRVAGGAVDLSFPLWTARVKRWGDSSTSQGRHRFHKVDCIDTMSKLVNKPLPAKSAQGWRPRLDDHLTSAGWQFGADIYGAESVDGTPTITVDDRDEVASAISEMDATLDPVGLVWRTQQNGRLLVHPAPWTGFHDAIFAGAGTIVGTEWVSPIKAYYPSGVRFSYDPVAEDAEVGFWPQVEGQSFGIESDVENVINEWKITHPDGMGGTTSYSYDDPVSASSYDTRPFPAANWIAENDTVVDDYVDTRAYADMVAQPLRTGLDLPGFFPACVLLDQWDDVSVLHATRPDRSTVTGAGWLRSIEHTIRARRAGQISWKANLQLDLTSSVQSDPLLPVENLAVSELTASQVTLGWTNPTQSVIPTETQVRIPELSDQWFPTAYPITSFAWLNLDPSTTLHFQVRLVRVVDEITTNVSPVREVAFITPDPVVPTPIDDGTTVLIPDPPDPGCTTDWKVEETADNGDTVTTTTTGDETDFVENSQGDRTLDISSVTFETGKLYRLCTNTDCGDGPQGWVCSAWFQPACATPAQLSTAPFDDAVMFVPEICGAQIFEAVSDTEVVAGPALDGIGTDDDGNYTLTTAATGNVVAYGDAPNVPLEDGDRSVHWRGVLGTVEPTDPLIRVGRLRLVVLDVGGGVHKFAAVKSFAGGSITAIGTTTIAADTEYDVYATWDRDTATVAIIVDGTEEDSTEDAASYVNTPNLPTFSAKLPPNSWCTELAAWDRVVEFATPFDPTSIAGLMAWYDGSDTATHTGTSDVTVVADKSGQGRTLARSGSASSVSNNTSTLNGKSVLSFNGSGYLSRSPAFMWVAGEVTIFVVASVATGSGFGMLVKETYTMDLNSQYGVRTQDIDVNQEIIWSGAKGGTGGSQWLLGKSGVDGQAVSPFLLAATDDGANWTLRVDGAATASGTYTRNNTTNINRFAIGGADWAGGDLMLTGYIAEVLIYDSVLSGSDLAAVEAYLSDKWGL